MNIGTILAQTKPEVVKALTDADKIHRIHEVIEKSPSGALYWVLILTAVSLVGIIWLVHRQQKLARNQVKLALLLEELARNSDK